MKENDGSGRRSLSPTMSPPPACSVLTPYWVGVPQALLDSETPPKDPQAAPRKETLLATDLHFSLQGPQSNTERLPLSGW